MLAYIDKFTKVEMVWANVFTEAITKDEDLPFYYAKLVLDSLKRASRGKILTKTSQDKQEKTNVREYLSCGVRHKNLLTVKTNKNIQPSTYWANLALD